MNERQKIEDNIRKKEQEIQNLEEKLKAAKVYVKALRDVLRILDKPSEPESAESTLRPGSAVAQARDVILRRGEPVHITKLLSELGKRQTREARASLASSLAAYVRRGEIFIRTAPNTFGLVELGHSSDEGQDADPPPDFGKLRPPPAPPPPKSEDDYLTIDKDDDIPF